MGTVGLEEIQSVLSLMQGINRARIFYQTSHTGSLEIRVMQWSYDEDWDVVQWLPGSRQSRMEFGLAFPGN